MRLEGKYDAVLFDLLSALLDSWSLWNHVAGGRERGLSWRKRYLDLTYETGRYRPYEDLVAEAAADVSLPGSVAQDLLSRWGELEPWPEVPGVLSDLERRVPVGVVTNCSEGLARQAVACTGVRFDVVVSAERAGWYKPRPEPYRMALGELGGDAARTLFVAGSPYDVPGAAGVGMDVFWHDRLGRRGEHAPHAAVAVEGSLTPLLGLVGAG